MKYVAIGDVYRNNAIGHNVAVGVDGFLRVAFGVYKLGCGTRSVSALPWVWNGDESFGLALNRSFAVKALHFHLLPANQAGFNLTQDQHSKWNNTCQVK
jgi:hypothetical protein